MPAMIRRTCAAVPLVLAGVALLAVGCTREEGIQSYTVPKATHKGGHAGPELGAYRLLGLMYPADNPEWFFKFTGPEREIEKYVDGFDEIAVSLRPVPNGLPEFKTPTGWSRGGPRGQFVAETIRVPDGELEVTVTRSAGGVKQNLERWVGQIGLKPGADDGEKYTRTLDVPGGKALRVDLRGPKNPATSRGPMMGGR